jgi:hypothetical protein
LIYLVSRGKENLKLRRQAMTYTEAVIDDEAAKSRARTISKKEALRVEIYKSTGWMPSKDLSMKLMKEAVGV